MKLNFKTFFIFLAALFFAAVTAAHADAFACEQYAKYNVTARPGGKPIAVATIKKCNARIGDPAQSWILDLDSISTITVVDDPGFPYSSGGIIRGVYASHSAPEFSITLYDANLTGKWDNLWYIYQGHSFYLYQGNKALPFMSSDNDLDPRYDKKKGIVPVGDDENGMYVVGSLIPSTNKYFRKFRPQFQTVLSAGNHLMTLIKEKKSIKLQGVLVQQMFAGLHSMKPLEKVLNAEEDKWVEHLDRLHALERARKAKRKSTQPKK
jgi:hypothetical protein